MRSAPPFPSPSATIYVICKTQGDGTGCVGTHFSCGVSFEAERLFFAELSRSSYIDRQSRVGDQRTLSGDAVVRGVLQLTTCRKVVTSSVLAVVVRLQPTPHIC